MAGYSYDAAGNLLNDGNCAYTYNDENEVTAVAGCATASYVYNAGGQRVRSIVNGTSADAVYDLQGRVVGEYGSGPEWNWGGIYANGRLAASYADSTTFFPLSDPLGTPRVWMTSGGAVSQDCANLAFGDGATCTADGAQFTGQIHDSATGLDNFKARYYSPMLGRFLTPDPAGMAAVDPNDPQTWNRYAYLNNSPLSATDPSGLTPQSWPVPPGEDGPDAGNCTIDGISAGCSWAEGMLALGSASICPDDSCGMVHTNIGGGQWGFLAQDALGNTWLATVGPTQAQWDAQQAANEAVQGWNAFLTASKYMDLSSNQPYTVEPYERGFAFGVLIPGAPLDVTKASANGWYDPLTLFDGGAQSWYQDPGAMFGVVHTIEAAGGASVHTDPFGPWNQPLHFLGQVVTGWFLGTKNYPALSCAISLGFCVISGN